MKKTIVLLAGYPATGKSYLCNKILENDFIQGKIEISTLSIERARRTGAVTSYEQARVTLHNSVILLEMLTNIKIIKEK